MELKITFQTLSGLNELNKDKFINNAKTLGEQINLQFRLANQQQL